MISAELWLDGLYGPILSAAGFGEAVDILMKFTFAEADRDEIVLLRDNLIRALDFLVENPTGTAVVQFPGPAQEQDELPFTADDTTTVPTKSIFLPITSHQNFALVPVDEQPA